MLSGGLEKDRCIPGTQCVGDFERTSPDKLHHFQKQQRPHSLLAAEQQIKSKLKVVKKILYDFYGIVCFDYIPATVSQTLKVH